MTGKKVLNELEKISIAGFSGYSDFIIYDENSKLVMMSLIGYTNQIESIMRLINSKLLDHDTESFYVNSVSRNIFVGNIKRNTRIKKIDNETSQLFINCSGGVDGELLRVNVTTSNNNIIDLVYNQLVENLHIPLIPEWKEYIYYSMLDQGCISDNRIIILGKHSNANILNATTKKISINATRLKSIIEEGLKSDQIHIGERGSKMSDKFNEVTGLDGYLELFSESIAESIEESFKPKFIPGVDKYSPLLLEFDQNCYDNGITLFKEQKNVIQSASNNLDKNDTTFVIGEMGTGR